MEKILSPQIFYKSDKTELAIMYFDLTCVYYTDAHDTLTFASKAVHALHTQQTVSPNGDIPNLCVFALDPNGLQISRSS